MLITGKRNPFQNHYQVGFDDEGRILALDVQLYSDGGAYADLSTAIMERAMLHVDNAYYIPNARITGQVCRTNFHPHTAFRGFGGPKGVATIENIIEEIAQTLKRDPLEIRKLNCYSNDRGNRTPYGQLVEQDMLPRLFDKLEESCAYARRRGEIERFNRASAYAAARPVDDRGQVRHLLHHALSQPGLRARQRAPRRHRPGVDGRDRDGPGREHENRAGRGRRFRHPRWPTSASCRRRRRRRTTPRRPRRRAAPTSTARPRSRRRRPSARGWRGSRASFSIGRGAARPRGRRRGDRARAHARARKTPRRRRGSSSSKAGSVDAGSRRVAFASSSFSTRLISIASASAATVMRDTREFISTRRPGRGSRSSISPTASRPARSRSTASPARPRCSATDILMDLGRPINHGVDLGQTTGAFVQGMGWVTTENLHYDAGGPPAHDLAEHVQDPERAGHPSRVQRRAAREIWKTRKICSATRPSESPRCFLRSPSGPRSRTRFRIPARASFPSFACPPRRKRFYARTLFPVERADRGARAVRLRDDRERARARAAGRGRARTRRPARADRRHRGRRGDRGARDRARPEATGRRGSPRVPA